MLGVCWEQVFLGSGLRVLLESLDVRGEAADTLRVLLEESQRGIARATQEPSELTGCVVMVHVQPLGLTTSGRFTDGVRPNLDHLTHRDIVLFPPGVVACAHARDFLGVAAVGNGAPQFALRVLSVLT